MEDAGRNSVILRQAQQYLRQVLGEYMYRGLREKYGDNWWRQGVYNRLYDNQQRNLPTHGDDGHLRASLDLRLWLILFANVHWDEMLSGRLKADCRGWAREIKTVYDNEAHPKGDGPGNEETDKALTAMLLLCEQLGPDAGAPLRALREPLRAGTAGDVASGMHGPMQGAAVVPSAPAAAVHSTAAAELPAWWDISEPHPDVAAGSYKKAEFAADLALVAAGKAKPEYADPEQFFARTYVTAGLKGLLVAALKRVTGGDGEPVLQLKTAFGGGKTHSMLAIYHLMRIGHTGAVPESLGEVLKAAGVSVIPRVNVATLVGTMLNPATFMRHDYLPGANVNTMWGEMTAQLARASGRPDLYRKIKASDAKGASPGSETFRQIFDACGPCVVLIDELVAYARKLYAADNLPAGTYGNFITFVQELTEGVKNSANSLVVATIPQSDIEIVDEAGRGALEQIEHTFGRVESVWTPVAAGEGFEVVRRRLFLECSDTSARDRICSEYSRMYRDQGSTFPPETRESDYEQRMRACYPIHPEMFDRLYGDWSTLATFQRTRGVLRLMAAVIHQLYKRDRSPMIMPGSLPLSIPEVREELTRCLENGSSWNAIVDQEIDGRSSWPSRHGSEEHRFGRDRVLERLARAVMLGSAPHHKEQSARGIERQRLLLGVMVPHEKPALFGDALSAMRDNLQYLYTSEDGQRFWYDIHPTLLKKARDLAQSQEIRDRAGQEVKERLRRLGRSCGGIAGVHVVPAAGGDVIDSEEARLVVLGLADRVVLAGDGGVNEDTCLAMARAGEILEHAGTSGDRLNRNMLLFLAPDGDALAGLQEAICSYLAWSSIAAAQDDLNLDRAQIREVKNRCRNADRDADRQLNAAYRWLLLPTGTAEKKWRAERLSEADESPLTKADRCLRERELLLDELSPSALVLKFREWLWQDGRGYRRIGELWEQACRYEYMPRLKNFEVLRNAIVSGMPSGEYFALAEGCDESSDTPFFELRYKEAVSPEAVNGRMLLVAPQAAQRQLARTAPAVPSAASGDAAAAPITAAGAAAPAAPMPPPRKIRRFCVSMDMRHGAKDYGKFNDAILELLERTPGCRLNVRIMVETEFAGGGLDDGTERSLLENCRTLRLEPDIIRE